MGSEDLVVMVEMLHDSGANQNENGFSNSDIYMLKFIPSYLFLYFSNVLSHISEEFIK